MQTLLIGLVLLSCTLASCQKKKEDPYENYSFGDGGLDGNGGLLNRTRTNPWFLGNVETVNYCIFIDKSRSSVTPQIASNMARKAFDYWKNDFRSAFYDAEGEDLKKLSIATQNFVEIPCGDTLKKSLQQTDIVFQLGVLTKQQARDLGNPSDFIGVSVMTDYDRKNLRGRGYVYIAPDDGKSSQLTKGVLSAADGMPLFYAMTHELGHVFGLRHEGHQWHVMGESFLGSTVGQDFAKYLDGKIDSVFTPSTFWTSQGGPDEFLCKDDYTETPEGEEQHYEKLFLGLSEFFGLPEAANCLQANINGSELTIKYKTDHEGSEITAGSARLNSEGLDGEQGVIIFLPKEQTVFPKEYVEKYGVFDDLYSASRRKYLYTGEYVYNDVERQLSVTSDSRGMIIGAVISGKYVFNIEEHFKN
ncbi:MAG: hypothetical protein AB7T49_06130 [Oligoflexales bacterium]